MVHKVKPVDFPELREMTSNRASRKKPWTADELDR